MLVHRFIKRCNTMTSTSQPEPPVSVQPMRVLFLCTHNSSRSQMAEGLLRARGGTAYAVFSAGTHPTEVHPLARRVMNELGIDLREHCSKGINMFADQSPMDLVVTVCDQAAEACPAFPRARAQAHWGFPDPSQVQVRLAAFRHIRDLIAVRITQFVTLHPSASSSTLYAAAVAAIQKR